MQAVFCDQIEELAARRLTQQLNKRQLQRIRTQLHALAMSALSPRAVLRGVKEVDRLLGGLV